MFAVAVDTFPHGPAEGCLRPAPDTSLGIRRDVAGIDGAEGRRHRQPAGEGFFPRLGVASGAVADRGQHGSLLDQRLVEGSALRRFDGIDRWLPGIGAEASRASDNEYENADPHAFQGVTPLRKTWRQSGTSGGSMPSPRMN